MRLFSSYGPINSKRHYYAPREKLIQQAYTQLVGEYPDEDGHYITVWAPRQCGKTWMMQEVVEKIRKTDRFEVGIISMQRAKKEQNEKKVLEILMEKLQISFGKSFASIEQISDIPRLFTKKYFQKPVVLILDEFDAVIEEFINDFASIFRDIFISRTNEKNKKTWEKTHLLHGLALVGVRSVLGIENQTGSPFNVQRSVHIPNLSFDEVKYLFKWYEKESGQIVEPEVIQRLFDETRGQPGLTCWFGELLSEGYEGYVNNKTLPISPNNFEEVLAAAINILPNNNILNIISKANEPEHKDQVLDLFKTDQKVEFTYDDKSLNFLYMNGVIDREKETRTRYYVKFASPFVQKRLFNYFSRELFHYMGKLYDTFDVPPGIITECRLDIPNLLRQYEIYLKKNREWLLKNAPRRADMRIFEAVYHFNLFSYLKQFLGSEGGSVLPEFPTGNGKIDLIINYAGHQYGIEVKSYTTRGNYDKSLVRAAQYGKQMGMREIFLVFFVDVIDEENRDRYEKDYRDETIGVNVIPIFVETGN
jgi:hypothetical protein